MKIPDDELDCTKCGACCEVMLVKADGTSREDMEFFKARGIKIIDGYAAIVSPCPLLVVTEGKKLCGIYEKRPLACRVFKRDGVLCHIARKARGLE